MAPLMSLNGDDIVEALLLEPMGNELRTSPTLEEEATLLGEELEPLEAPEVTAFLQEYPETPKPEEPTEWIDTHTYPCSFPLLQNPAAILHRKQRNHDKGLSPKAHQPPTKILSVTGSSFTLRTAERYLTGGGNSGPFATQVPSPSMTPKSKT